MAIVTCRMKASTCYSVVGFDRATCGLWKGLDVDVHEYSPDRIIYNGFGSYLLILVWNFSIRSLDKLTTIVNLDIKTIFR